MLYIAECTFAVKLFGLIMQLDGRRIFFWSRYYLVFIFIGRSLWWVVQWLKDRGPGDRG